MKAFYYRNGSLYVEKVSVAEMAQTVQTPFYAYSEQEIRSQMQAFTQAATKYLSSFTVCFALKSNANISVIKVIASMGGGADIVSGGELMLALKAGIAPEKIVFSGVGKTREELTAAVENGIGQINLESEEEAEMLEEISLLAKKKTRVAVRVNPDVDAHTHQKITTGKKENKFGVAWENARPLYRRLAQSKGLIPVGLDVHVGSQLLETEPFEKAFDRTAGIVEALKADGIGLETIDVGGGLGVAYRESDEPCSVDAYMKIVADRLGKFGCRIIFEPGRFLIAPAGILVSKVVRIKHTTEKNFLVLDAGMNDLIRPAIYDAYHGVKPVKEGPADQTYDVVGPVCESSDVFGKDRKLPVMLAGDLVVLETAGAYGASMGSNYNFRPLCAEVLVNDDKFSIIRKAQTIDDIWAANNIAPWI